MEKPWAGRFREKTKKIVETFTSSVSYDRRLSEYDIQGSVAHVKMLKKRKIISSKDAESILKGIEKIRQSIQKGKFKFSEGLEDVHMNIEHALVKETGLCGGRLHTARSRNDQIALDMRLLVRDEIRAMQGLMRDFQAVLVRSAEKHIDIVMPGYTHLQRAQPVLLSHHLLAYFEMVERDKERFEDCFRRVNVMPLGSGALAGTTLPIDRNYTAQLLKFPCISRNSIDAVSDRDFVAEFIFSASLLMVHLSRLSEELILWSSGEFNFVELPDSFSTGSSIMPQKKNPDILELIRGKTGRTFGNLMAVLVVLKGLPLAYNRDLQEDKEPLFDTIDTVKACLTVLTEMMPKLKFHGGIMRKAAEGGFSTATDLAEYLVRKGVPFREAHKITGIIVRYCLEKKKTLLDLDLKELRKYSKLIKQDVFDYLTVNASINKKDSPGSTARKRVLNRIREIKSGK